MISRIPAAVVMALLVIAGANGAKAQGRGRGNAPPLVTTSAMETLGHLGPIVKDGMLEPVTEYSDTLQWIKQRVWVETNFDSDHDGKKDRVHVDIVRPAVAEKAGVKLPIIMKASPYLGRGQGNVDWNVEQELGATPPHRTPPPYRAPFAGDSGAIRASYAAEWVPRGLIAVDAEQVGTGLSTGCPTSGDTPERLSASFVIDWLNGRAKGYTTVDGNVEVRATAWTNGRVGMYGGSYEGAMPMATATTGVEGLMALIPISPNTSDYRYYRSFGLVRSPGSYLGEDIDVLYDYVHSGRVRERCDSLYRDGDFAKHMDRAHGDFSDFWDVRDQTKYIKNVHAAVLFAHGFNDWNVMPDNTIRMWEALKKINPSAKLYMSQGGHGAPPPEDIQNKWWAHYLYGVNNGVDTLPRAMIVQSTAVAAPPPAGVAGRGGRGGAAPYPVFFKDWPIPGTQDVTLHLAKGGAGVGALAFKVEGKQGEEKLVDDWHIKPGDMARAASSPNRLLYALPTLGDSIHMSGASVVRLRLALSKPAANLSVYLVTLPFDPSTIGSTGQVGIVTRGWADPQNYKSLKDGGDYVSKKPGEPLVPGKFYEMTFPLQPDDQIIKPGQQLALMILSSDNGFTLRPTPGTQITVDLDKTSITIPVLGGEAALRKALLATPPAPAAAPGSVLAYTDSQVDQMVRQTCTAPVYPDSLRRAGVSGSVQLRYIVGLDGRAETPSMKVMSSTNRLFEQPAINAALNCTGVAAQIKGMAVRQLVEQVVRFSPPKGPP